MGYIARLWRGEIRLVVTFWVYAVLVPIGGNIVLAFLFPTMAARPSLTLIVGNALYLVFAFVIVWRSSDDFVMDHRGRPWRFWAHAAIFVVVLQLVGSAASFLSYRNQIKMEAAVNELLRRQNLTVQDSDESAAIREVSASRDGRVIRHEYVVADPNRTFPDQTAIDLLTVGATLDRCRDEVSAGFLSVGYTVEHTYRDPDGTVLHTVTVTEGDCR